MQEKAGGVGAFRMAGGGRVGMRTQFRWGRVSWDGTGRQWKGRGYDRKAPGEATGEPGSIWHGRGRGFALEEWLLGKVRWTALDASGHKKVAPGQTEPRHKYQELEFTL